MDFHVIKNNCYYQKYKSFFQILLYSLPLFFGLFLHVGKIFIFSQGPIHATDFETPLNPIYYFWNILYPWHPLGLGSISYINTFEMIYGIISFISFGNVLISQIITLSLPPIIGYIGIFLITRKILHLNLFGCIFASFFYAFSPPFLAWFSLPYMLGFSLIPILVFFIIKLVIFCTNDKNFSFKYIGTYSLCIAIILSILTNIYFHSFPFLFISLSLVCIFVLIGEKQRLNKKLLKRILIVITLIVILYLGAGSLFKLGEISNIFLDPERQSLILRTGEPGEIVDSIKVFYNDATLSNVTRLGGGTPNNERYSFFNNNLIGFILPFFVFFGLLFLKKSTKRSICIYLSCIINSLLIFLIVIFLREMAMQDNYIVTNFIFSGVRRPERFLELLVIYYAIAIAFTISGINLFLSNIKNIKILHFPYFKKILKLLLFVFLIIAHISYVGFLSDSSDPMNSQFFISRPKDFVAIEDFLNNDQFQTSSYNSNYRYMIIPSYVQMNVFTRYNYPNFFYGGSFSSKEAQEFIIKTNNLIGSQNLSAIIPLSLASVRYICVLPESFGQDELQSWRLMGYTRSSGVYLFGDINSYRDFISGFSETTLISDDKNYIYNNSKALSRVYVPTMLVHSKGRLEDVFEGLKIIENILPLSNFSLLSNQSEDKLNKNFLIDDFSKQTRYNITLYNINYLNYLYDNVWDTKQLTRKSIIIWSENNSISIQDSLIIIKSIIPEDKESISIWVKIPTSTISEKPLLKFRFHIHIEMQDDLEFQLLDEGGKKILAEFEKTISLFNDDQAYLDLTINPSNTNVTWLKVTINGVPGSTKEFSIENRIEYEQITDLKIFLNYSSETSIDARSAAFPIMINPDKDRIILWPTEINENVIEYAINEKIDLNKSLLFMIFNSSIGNGWIKQDEDVTWLSPIEINIDLNISLLNMEKDDGILVPVFFGNIYDESWILNPIIEGGKVNSIRHIVGNGFGNLWLVNISGISTDNNNIQISFILSYNKIQLELYRKYTMICIFSILFVFPLYIIEIKQKNVKKQNNDFK